MSSSSDEDSDSGVLSSATDGAPVSSSLGGLSPASSLGGQDPASSSHGGRVPASSSLGGLDCIRLNTEIAAEILIKPENAEEAVDAAAEQGAVDDVAEQGDAAAEHGVPLNREIDFLEFYGGAPGTAVEFRIKVPKEQSMLLPSNEQSIPSKKLSIPSKEHSIPSKKQSDHSIPSKKQSIPSKEQLTSKESSVNAAAEHGVPLNREIDFLEFYGGAPGTAVEFRIKVPKEHSSKEQAMLLPSNEQSISRKEQSFPSKGHSILSNELSIPRKEQSFPSKEHSIPNKKQSISSKEPSVNADAEQGNALAEQGDAASEHGVPLNTEIDFLEFYGGALGTAVEFQIKVPKEQSSKEPSEQGTVIASANAKQGSLNAGNASSNADQRALSAVNASSNADQRALDADVLQMLAEVAELVQLGRLKLPATTMGTSFDYPSPPPPPPPCI